MPDSPFLIEFFFSNSCSVFSSDNDDFLSCFAVSKFYHIGCFNHDADAIPALERRRRELDINKVSAVVINCAKLAQENGHSYFSVGYKGVCYSGPQGNETYFEKGPAETKKKCSSGGVGKKGAAVVYTFGKSVNLSGNIFFCCTQSFWTSFVKFFIYLALFIICQASERERWTSWSFSLEPLNSDNCADIIWFIQYSVVS